MHILKVKLKTWDVELWISWGINIEQKQTGKAKKKLKNWSECRSLSNEIHLTCKTQIYDEGCSVNDEDE